MKRRTLLLALLPLSALAAPPAVTLVVELRWVDSKLPPAAQAAVRDGAVVVGTAGSISPRGPGLVTSTAAPAPQQIQRLNVLNGRRGTLRLTTREPLQWVDAVVQFDPATRTPQRVYASPRSAEGRTTQSFSFTPSWAGGKAPVQIEFDIDQDEHALQSTLQLPLDHWQTVARVGTTATPAPKGTLSSADAAGRSERELQLRVSIQP
jgi:hypothetical protein